MAVRNGSLGGYYKAENFLPTTNLQLTMAAWVRPESSLNRNILSLAGSGTDTGRISLRMLNTYQASMQVVGAVTGSANSTNTGSANIWMHIAGVVVSSNSKLAYLNGDASQRGSNATANNFSAQIDSTYIGASWANGLNQQATSTSIAEIGIWDTVLNDDEIYALSRGFRPSLIKPSNLKMYVPYINFETVIDLSNNIPFSRIGTNPVLFPHPHRIG
jgi:hypothetical protein